MKRKTITLFLAGFLGVSMGVGGLMTFNAKAEATTKIYNLGTEIGKIQSVETMKEDSIFSFYAGVKWQGPYEQMEYSTLSGTANAAIGNYSKIEVSEDRTVSLKNAESGWNTVFSYTGTHTVGTAAGEDADRVWAIGWTAPSAGTVTISEETLTIVGMTNANLSMGFSKGARVKMNPADESLNWETYEAAADKQYVVEPQTFSVAKGEQVFINLYAAKNSEEVQEGTERTVQFTYNPNFVFEPTPAHLHVYNHVQKLTFDDTNALVNNVQITDDDETTYPFSYLYRSTGGSTAGFTGQENASGVAEMARTSVAIDPSQKRLYAGETYSGFMTTGQIVTVARTPDPMNVVLGFTAPQDGALTISDIAFKYNAYPNATNGYKKNDTEIGEAFKGYVFRVLLNGTQVWPVDGGWDHSLAKLYETATDGYAAGDLIAAQSTGNIENILVRKYDKVYFEITRADIHTTEALDVLDFNPTYTIDSSVNMDNYVAYTTASDYFDVTNVNDETTKISYWSVDTSKGLYNNASYSLMSSVDYAALAYTTDILDDHASEVGWNYLRPKKGQDAAIGYLASASGNLTISGESKFRGGNLTLWEYYDIVSKGNLLETDGVRIRIEVNGKRVWPANNTWKSYSPHIGNNGVFEFEDVTIGVQKNDRVTIRINCGESELYDGLNFNPSFGFVQTVTPMTNPPLTMLDPKDETTNNGGEQSGEEEKGCGSTLGGGLVTLSLVGAALATVLKKHEELS